MNFDSFFIALYICFSVASISAVHSSPLTSFDAVPKSGVKKSGSFSFLFGCRLLPVGLTTDFSLSPFGAKARSVALGEK